MNLTGRVALVTGASQGIGRACALKLAQCGARVALVARNQQKLAEVAEEIITIARAGTPAPPQSGSGGTGVLARAFASDVENEDQIKAAFKAVIAEFGKIDILVNNAGITRDQLIMRMKRADWNAVLDTNLTSAYVCTQQAINSMLKQRWGRIINITSIFGQTGQAGQANYAASKAGLIGLTMAMAREVASRSITVNAVAPGWIDTDMTAGLNPEVRESALKAIPLGRPGTEADVAHAVKFLASEEAAYITGQVIGVNGGMLMG